MAETEIELQTSKESQNKMEYGVLLYYKYADIPDIEGLFDFFKSNCTALSLLGRVRLSTKGVNVTVGGRLKALEEHIEALKSNPLFEGTDFKLASCGEPLNDQVAKECGFTSLSIRVVKELVTLSSHPLLKSPDIRNAGRHLTADEFHSVLQDAAGKKQEESSDPDDDMILLDARNLYETRIGKFHAPNVKTLDLEIRQYSDLPLWIDDNSEQLRGKKILMYCTGGIRCEMASAYIRSKGAGFENVFQLYGGIQRYMEQIPDGGFFKGKNFVFDHRVSVGSSNGNILGTCLVCSVSYDDYTSRCRCAHCRMLVLVCDICRENSSSYVCELCQRNGKPMASISPLDYSSEASEQEPADITSSDLSLSISQTRHADITSSCDKGQHKPARKLRILCLHGFRQNASGFRGRTSSLAKKLKNMAEFVFVDAPHELPFIYQPQVHCTESNTFAVQNPPTNHCNRKYAWLVSTDDHHNEKQDSEWRIRTVPFESLQYQQQTEGFEKSIEYLKTVFSQQGPFDGILGFSQGAAMAALVSSRKEELKGELDFLFVMCFSGFAVNISEDFEGFINCPSIHVFGNREGQDRQIDCESSRRLASLFEEGSRVVIEHDFGHMIPTRSPYIDEIKEFLRRFV